MNVAIGADNPTALAVVGREHDTGNPKPAARRTQ